MKSFTPEEVRQIAKLAALSLTPEEEQEFAGQFSTILEHFDHLQDLDVSELTIDPDQSHLVAARKDEARSSEVTPEAFSPYYQEQGFRVPKVIEGN